VRWSDEWRDQLGERVGSGDGERETSVTRQIAFEPLPASEPLCLCFWSQVTIGIPSENGDVIGLLHLNPLAPKKSLDRGV
jgi:hypothetical protein